MPGHKYHTNHERDGVAVINLGTRVGRSVYLLH